MAKNEKRVKITLACEDCKRRNYITMKSKVNDRERIEMKKYCRWDKRHTVHKETRASPRRGPAAAAAGPGRNLSGVPGSKRYPSGGPVGRGRAGWRRP